MQERNAEKAADEAAKLKARLVVDVNYRIQPRNEAGKRERAAA